MAPRSSPSRNRRQTGDASQIRQFDGEHVSQIGQSVTQDEESSEQPYLTYREKKRMRQAERNGPKRGETRGLKYIAVKEKEKNNLKEKPYAKLDPDLRRVVGENADRFICELSLWVKDYCPLNSSGFKKMDAGVKTRLLEKIKANWDLPVVVADKPVDQVLESQCGRLYGGWRYRLKEKYFRRVTKRQAEANRPNGVGEEEWKWLVYQYWGSKKQQDISEKARKNRLKQTIVPANGARSTARIFYDMVNAPPSQSQEPNAEESDPMHAPEDPLYVRLYEKTKRHVDGRWDPDAETNYNQLKELHDTQVERYGEDNLGVREAYAEVLKERRGYVRGLGAGALPLKKAKYGRESSELRDQLTNEIQQLQETQHAFAEKEVALQTKIQDLKTSNEELQSSNEQLRGDMESMKREMLERENKFREEILKMLQSSK